MVLLRKPPKSVLWPPDVHTYICTHSHKHTHTNLIHDASENTLLYTEGERNKSHQSPVPPSPPALIRCEREARLCLLCRVEPLRGCDTLPSQSPGHENTFEQHPADKALSTEQVPSVVSADFCDVNSLAVAAFKHPAA